MSEKTKDNIIDNALRTLISSDSASECSKELAQRILDDEMYFGSVMVVCETICKADPFMLMKLLSRVAVQIKPEDMADFILSDNEDIPKGKMN